MEKIYHITPKWSEQIMVDPRPEPLCRIQKTPNGGWEGLLALPLQNNPNKFLISFPIHNGPMVGELYEAGKMKTWGMEKIGPGTWKIDPSIHQPGIIHAYLVFCQVPEPAPWEI